MDNNKQPFAETILQGPFFWAIIGISALSTFAFYSTYVEAIIPQFIVDDPTIRNLITGGIGVLLLEGAAVAWQKIMHFRSLRTPRQLDIADKASKSALYISIGISLAYLVLSTSLINDERIINIAGVMGLLLIIASTGLQLWFAYHYNHYSLQAEERRLDAQAAAAAIDEYTKLRMDDARSRATAVAQAAWNANQPITTSDLLSRMTHGATPSAPPPAATMARDVPAAPPVAPASATSGTKSTRGRPRPS